MNSSMPAISRVLALALPLLLLNCAKTGDPQPPLVRVPKPSADLTASQFADVVILTISMPRENTDGSPAETLGEVEVFRLVEERTSPAADLAEEDVLSRGDRIFGVRKDFAGALQGNTLVFRDPIPPADRARYYKSRLRYAVRLINTKGQTAGLGNQAVIAPVPVPLPPADLASEASQEFVRIRWNPPLQNSDGSRPANIAGYRIYRSEDPLKFPPSPLNQAPLEKPEYEDRAFQFDKTYYYAVSVLTSRVAPLAESSASAPLAVVAADRFPPPSPQNLQAILEKGTVILLWTAPEAPDIAGYRIYRSGAGDVNPRLIIREPVTLLSHRDENVTPAGNYRYAVRAVDTHGNEGPPAEISIDIP